MLTRRIGAWAGPVTGTVAVLCAAIAIAYASGTRVEVSIPAAADIGGPTPTGTNSGAATPSKKSTLMLVHPTHPVEVLDESDDVTEAAARPATPSPSPGAPSATRRGDDSPASTPPDASPVHPVEVVPTVTPAPDSRPAQPTDTWSDDDPSTSPRPSPSDWKPTDTPSWSPSGSYRDDGSEDDGAGGASQSDS